MKLAERLTQIYDAAIGTYRWQDALDAIQGETGSLGAMFYTSGKNSQLQFDSQLLSTSYDHIGKILPEYNALVAQKKWNSGLDAQGSSYMHAAEPFKPVLDSDIWPIDDEYARRPEIRFTMEKMGFYRRFFVNLSRDPMIHSALLVHYGNELRTAPPAQDMAAVEFLAPHLGKALEISRTFDSLRQKYNAVLSVLDKFDVAICLVNSDGQVILQNRQASDLFSARDCVWVDKKNRLQGRSDNSTDRIRHLCREVALTAEGNGSRAGAEFEIVKRSDGRPLYAIASPLRDAEVELGSEIQGSLLTLIDGEEKINPRSHLAAEAYDLSSAESSVLPLVIRGLSNNECAEMLDVRPETIKSHVSSILAKMKCRNRIGLVWRVFQYSPPVL